MFIVVSVQHSQFSGIKNDDLSKEIFKFDCEIARLDALVQGMSVKFDYLIDGGDIPKPLKNLALAIKKFAEAETDLQREHSCSQIVLYVSEIFKDNAGGISFHQLALVNDVWQMICNYIEERQKKENWTQVFFEALLSGKSTLSQSMEIANASLKE